VLIRVGKSIEGPIWRKPKPTDDNQKRVPYPIWGKTEGFEEGGKIRSAVKEDSGQGLFKRVLRADKREA